MKQKIKLSNEVCSHCGAQLTEPIWFMGQEVMFCTGKCNKPSGCDSQPIERPCMCCGKLVDVSNAPSHIIKKHDARGELPICDNCKGDSQ